MSRPAAAVQRVVKAYDIRGLVGAEIDEALIGDVGAAFAGLMRDEGAGQVVILKFLLRRGFDVELESSTVETRGSVNWRTER